VTRAGPQYVAHTGEVVELGPVDRPVGGNETGPEIEHLGRGRRPLGPGTEVDLDVGVRRAGSGTGHGRTGGTTATGTGDENRRRLSVAVPYMTRGPLVAFDSAAQPALFVARLRGGVNRSAIAAIADGTRL
jgi:hypothetical protein